MSELESVCQDIPFSLKSKAHIVVFDKNSLNKVLNGKKRLESRFSKERCVPYGSIDNGDTIYLKESGGPIVAKATADKIKFYPNLNSEKIKILKYTYSTQLCVNDEFWNKEKDSLYATMFNLKDIKGITPITTPKSDQQPWVVINQGTDSPECIE